MPIDDVAPFLYILLNLIEKLCVPLALQSKGDKFGKNQKHLIFVDDPAFELVVVAIVAILVFDDLVDGEVL